MAFVCDFYLEIVGLLDFFVFVNVVLGYQRRLIEGLLGGAWTNRTLWWSKIGVEHLTNPGDHANLGFSIFLKSNS